MNIKLLKQFIATLPANIKTLLQTLISADDVSVMHKVSEKSKAQGINIYGIDVANKVRLLENEDVANLVQAIEETDGLNYFAFQGDKHPKPALWIGQSSGGSQSKEFKDSLFE